ncbi:MAG: hypothetical protein ACYS1A_13690 [Planctomycetota bacterium]
MQNLAEKLADCIASILRVPGDWLRELTVAVSVDVARGIFLLYFVILLIWVVTMKSAETSGTVPGRRKPIDLRYFAAAALIVQLILYVVF